MVCVTAGGRFPVFCPPSTANPGPLLQLWCHVQFGHIDSGLAWNDISRYIFAASPSPLSSFIYTTSGCQRQRHPSTRPSFLLFMMRVSYNAMLHLRLRLAAENRRVYTLLYSAKSSPSISSDDFGNSPYTPYTKSQFPAAVRRAGQSGQIALAVA